MGAGKERIRSEMGRRAVASGAGKADGKVIYTCHAGAGQNTDFSRWKIGRHMDRKYGIHSVKHPVIDQRSGFSAGFLRRLKHEPHGAGKMVTAVPKKLRRPQQHGRMGVVSAGMHDAGRL